MTQYILAHDLGTSGNKATLFGEDGRLVDSRTRAYPTEYGPYGMAEQNPADWWKAVRDSTRELLEDKHPDQVAAIAFSGQMMGCLCVDKSGKPLRPHMLYCDQRATREEEAFAEKGGRDEIYRVTGHRASASYSVAKLMWVRDNQPEIFRRTHKMLNAKDYLNFLLTGKMTAELTDASGTCLLDLREGEWSDYLLDAAGLDRKLLPDLVKSTDIVGELTPDAAEALGLRAGIPVAAGAGDGLCAGVGAGSVAPGRVYNYIGSSSWIGITTTEPVYDSRQRTFTWAHAVPGLFHPMGTMQTAGACYAWLKEQVCHEEYEAMNEIAASSPPGANGLVFLPYLLGERSPRWNPKARGGFIGLTMSHGQADMVRAVLEGVTMNLAIIVDIFRERGELGEEMAVIGGGARGGVWRRIMADLYGVDIVRPNYLEEATSIGAAIIAGVGAGIYKDFSVADKFFSIVDRTRPDMETRASYGPNREVFEKVYQALKPVFPYFA